VMKLATMGGSCPHHLLADDIVASEPFPLQSCVRVLLVVQAAVVIMCACECQLIVSVILEGVECQCELQ
jgi:hypothetical protein